MLNPSEIKQKAERLYPIFLNATIKGELFFPIEFPVGKLSSDYILLRDALTQLLEKSKQSLGYGYIVELTTRKTRKYGNQTLPTRVFIETEADYLKLINREKEFAAFKANVALIRAEVPQLEIWLVENPIKVIEYADQWSNLLKVCQYFQVNPSPNLYIRELPIKVHTKFIEEHKGIIRNLLESILPLEAIQPVEFEKDHVFEKRFSLQYNEPLVRLRVLDKTLKVKYCFPTSDFSTPISEFRQLNLRGHNFIITENLMNFLTLPTFADTFALFGSGYGIRILKSISWLADCSLFYWGDLDAHGFDILSQYRSYFPHTISVMMDRDTLKTFEEFVVPATKPNTKNPQYLTPEEYDLFLYLSKQEKGLEQERISQDYANQYLHNMFSRKV